MRKTAAKLRLLFVSAVLAIAMLAIASSASAATITSAGPLTAITISPDLNCAVNHTGDSAGEWFANTACGTLAVDQSAATPTLYGPASIPAGDGAGPRTRTRPSVRRARPAPARAAIPSRS